MHIEVISLSPRDSFGMTLVKVSVSAKRESDTTDGGDIGVFIPATDSISETRRNAIIALRRLAQEILDAEPVENPETDEEAAAEIAARVAISTDKLFAKE
jgi:hypothetical protein